MSLSAAGSSGLRRKRTTSERAATNGDPLVVRKKAREASKAAMGVNAEPATAPKKKTNVSHHFFFTPILILPI